MGNGSSLADNQEVEYQSGASRMLNNICMAICVAPLLLLAMCALLGYNEQRAVCDQRAVMAGSEAVQEVGCDKPSYGSGSLVMFSCDIDTASLPQMKLPGAYFSRFSHQGTGIRVHSEMFQCIEHDYTTEEKTQGGGKRIIHTYWYSKEWRSEHVDSGSFRARGSSDWQNHCGEDNPYWDASVPSSGSSYAQQMKVGEFTTAMTNKVPLATPIPNLEGDKFWQQVDTGSFYRSRGGQASYARIGDVRVTFYSNDPFRLKTTVLGNNNQGTIEKWIAPPSWLCSGFTLLDLRMGIFSKDDLFKLLSSEANMLTWILRFVGFALMWFAFCLCFGPLEVAADCIPCIGPCLGDSIARITCCISCLPATACTLGVAGIVWVAMRPMVGIPCVVAFIAMNGGFGSYVAKAKAQKRRAAQVSAPVPQAQYGATAVAKPVMAQPAQ